MENIITQGNRVRKSTSMTANLIVDEKTLENVIHYADKPESEISMRIRELDREWDIERVLGTNMSLLALTGIGLSVFSDRKWLLLPTVVVGFFAQHALQGWCPPITLFRAMKIRTREEINQEKHALKAIRGDYQDIPTPLEAFEAARKS
jgi:hypothetical protein